MSSRDHSVPTSLVLGLQTCVASYMDAENLNRDPHAGLGSTLLTEPSLQIQGMELLRLTRHPLPFGL